MCLDLGSKVKPEAKLCMQVFSFPTWWCKGDRRRVDTMDQEEGTEDVNIGKMENHGDSL